MTRSERPRPGLARALARAVLWPLRRFFDPRFGGLAQQADSHQEDLAERLQTLGREIARFRADFDTLAHAEMDAVREANELIGRSLGDLLAEASSTTAVVEELERRLGLVSDHSGNRGGRGLVEDLDARAARFAGYGANLRARGSVAELDAHAAEFLNYASSHEGFAAQEGLWFNPPISLRYEQRRVRPANTNERIVEGPYVYRALGAVKAGASVLDVGAAESTLAFSLASLGYDVTALDIRDYSLAHPRLRVVTADILDWETSESFDVVLCVSTLEHIGLDAYGAATRDDSADQTAIERLRALTRPGGILVLTVPFGPGSSDETQRSYDRPKLERLLGDWTVRDLTIVRQEDDLTWSPDDLGRGGDPQQRRVALVTAVRPLT